MSAPATPTARRAHFHEWLGVIFFFILCALLVVRVVQAAAPATLVALVVSAVVGFVAADLVSGVVHWLFDTWFSKTTPVLGPTFVTPFRVHHEDPLDITRHGFVATNGHNCLASVPVLALTLLLPTGPQAPFASALLTFVLALCLGIFGTNQFHKWSHQEHVSPVIAWMQARGLILNREHHDVHHTMPYARHYCITTGWLNRPLEAIGFFRGLERIITAITGQQPRVDDLHLDPTPAPSAIESAPASELERVA